MELMDRCLGQLYKLVYKKLELTIPETVVGKMAEAVSNTHNTHTQHNITSTNTHTLHSLTHILLQTVKALHFLKANLNVLHRGRSNTSIHSHTHTQTLLQM